MSGLFRYSIVRYVPDPVRGEQMNVGVVAGDRDGSQFAARFLGPSQLSRLKRLGFAENFGFVAELAAKISSSSKGAQIELELGSSQEQWTLDTVEHAVIEWANTIQFSELRAAAAPGDVDALVDELFSRYVAPPRRSRRRARDKRWVKKKVTSGLRSALTAADQDPDAVLRQDESVKGEFDVHTFDFALANGKRQQLVETMSFETTDRRALRTEVDALAWTIDDVRRADTEVPITIATIGKGKILEDAANLYESLTARVVREDGLDPWVAELSEALIAAAGH